MSSLHRKRSELTKEELEAKRKYDRDKARERRRKKGAEINARQRERYANDPEYKNKKLDRSRTRYAEDEEFREKQKAATDSRRKADPNHKEKHNAQSREYYDRDRDEICANRRSKYANDPEYRALRIKHDRTQAPRLRKIRRENKQMCADYLGGKCSYCDEHMVEVLQFHHRDPAEKEYEIGNQMSVANLKLSDVKAELDKCDLLCANCHIMRHTMMVWNKPAKAETLTK